MRISTRALLSPKVFMYRACLSNSSDSACRAASFCTSVYNEVTSTPLHSSGQTSYSAGAEENDPCWTSVTVFWATAGL
ncbi:hypothetical protein Y032_0009g687 [Ancylostoma ceylanicum]|uniref:Uncharacterized protein n=1 Tax=Ancylostoma ceylanicum TaxID=53326 RepID=A0A016VKT2_9BILA|nr:hypothetical protein Y032_0009g687 [Ancylostoma ceylanicum]